MKRTTIDGGYYTPDMDSAQVVLTRPVDGSDTIDLNEGKTARVGQPFERRLLRNHQLTKAVWVQDEYGQELRPRSAPPFVIPFSEYQKGEA